MTRDQEGPKVQIVELEPNFVQRFYRGGEGIAKLRGVPWPNEYVPEDWLGSVTSVWDDSELGVTRLPDGRLLSQACSADPQAFFGADHVARHGASPALLVKLLEGAQRLPVHFHPSREFAKEKLGAPYGKTEAWYVVATGAAGGVVHLGFREQAQHETVRRWVDEQDVAAMLGALNRLEVQAGDTIFVPAGVPHAIGEDVLILELQEPSDLSVLMEWEGYEVDGAAEGHMGLGFETALSALDTSALLPARIASLMTRAGERKHGAGAAPLFPPASRPFFAAESVVCKDAIELSAGFSVLLLLEGEGSIEAAGGGSLALRRGSAALIPHAAGSCRLTGELRAVRALPPMLDGRRA